LDPLTVYIMVAMMMLLNGGVLGLIHGDLPQDLRSSAVSWRIGTLLQAGGAILLAVQAQLPAGFILPLANGMLLLGMTGCWRALRQFYGQPDYWAMLLPALLGTVGIAWFAALQPDLLARIWVASITWCVVLTGCVVQLHQARQLDPSRSRAVLVFLCGFVATFMLLRALYFGLVADPGSSVLDFGQLMNMLTPILTSVLPVIGTTAFLLLCSDRMRRQWERAASTDYLTGLPNRRTIATAGARRLALAREQASTLALVIIDIDHFKKVNDALGHDVGDLALRHVAQCIESSLRAVDMPGRQGGEEFVVLLAVADRGEALQRAEQICAYVRQHPFITPSGASRIITVSAGVAVLQPQDLVLDDLLRRADRVLYVAKANGRDRVEIA
jgi:diguanylate cyclase (GGDEF)-like protein